jgi:hypothetical protein
MLVSPLMRPAPLLRQSSCLGRCAFFDAVGLLLSGRVFSLDPSELPGDLDTAARAARRGHFERLLRDGGWRRLHHAAPPDLTHARVWVAERLVERVPWTMGVLVLCHARVRVGAERPRTECRGGGRTFGENRVGDLEVEDLGLAGSQRVSHGSPSSRKSQYGKSSRSPLGADPVLVKLKLDGARLGHVATVGTHALDHSRELGGDLRGISPHSSIRLRHSRHGMHVELDPALTWTVTQQSSFFLPPWMPTLSLTTELKGMMIAPSLSPLMTPGQPVSALALG